jgi:hypothetical protein
MADARPQSRWGFRRIALLCVEVLLIMLILAIILATVFPAIYIARQG